MSSVTWYSICLNSRIFWSFKHLASIDCSPPNNLPRQIGGGRCCCPWTSQVNNGTEGPSDSSAQLVGICGSLASSPVCFPVAVCCQPAHPLRLVGLWWKVSLDESFKHLKCLAAAWKVPLKQAALLSIWGVVLNKTACHPARPKAPCHVFITQTS